MMHLLVIVRLLAFLIGPLLVCAVLRVEIERPQHDVFRIGSFPFHLSLALDLSSWADPYSYAFESSRAQIGRVHQSFEHCLPVWRSCAAEAQLPLIYRTIEAANGLTLVQTAASIPVIPACASISHRLNACTSDHSMAPTGIDKECLYQAAMALLPTNALAVKNYGYSLEWSGFASMATSLYRQSIAVSHNGSDSGTLLHSAFVAPTLLKDEKQAARVSKQILNRVAEILSNIDFYRDLQGLSMLPSGLSPLYQIVSRMTQLHECCPTPVSIYLDCNRCRC